MTTARPRCVVAGCQRPAAIRDRTVSGRVRYRRRCLWHHRHADTSTPPPERLPLTTGVQCIVKGCCRAPEAFRRPDGRVYVRDVCRVHRHAPSSAVSAKAGPSPRQLTAPTITGPVALTSPHKPWQETPLKRHALKIRAFPTVRVKGGVWVRDDALGWFVPDSHVRTILTRSDSSLSLAKSLSLPTRVILTVQSQASRGRL